MKNILAITLSLFLYILTSAQEFNGIEIGNQGWMDGYLNVNKFRNGDDIPLAKTNEEWKKAGEQHQPAWCYYNSSSRYKLYNYWAVVDPRGIAPEGWKVPSKSDFEDLMTYLGDKWYCHLMSKSWPSEDTWGNEFGLGEDACDACLNWSDEIKARQQCYRCSDKRVVMKQVEFPLDTYGFSAMPNDHRDDDGKTVGSYSNDRFYVWTSTIKEQRVYKGRTITEPYVFAICLGSLKGISVFNTYAGEGYHIKLIRE